MSCSFVFDPLCSCIFEQDDKHGFHSLSLTKDELSRHKISEEVSKTLFHSTDSSYSLAYIPDFRVYDFFHPVGNKSFPNKCKRGEAVIINKSLSLIESHFKCSCDIAFLFQASLYSFFVLLRKSKDGECVTLQVYSIESF